MSPNVSAEDLVWCIVCEDGKPALLKIIEAADAKLQELIQYKAEDLDAWEDLLPDGAAFIASVQHLFKHYALQLSQPVPFDVHLYVCNHILHIWVDSSNSYPQFSFLVH